MKWERFGWFSMGSLAVMSVLSIASCTDGGGSTGATMPAEDRRKDFVKPEEISVAEDGLAYVMGDAEPFTGASVTRDKDWRPRYFAYYYEGKLHGPEMRWRDDGTLKRIFDYHHGEMNRRREYFENGNLDMDALVKWDSEKGKEVGFGRHLLWYEDGSVRWVGSFAAGEQWHGPIEDYAEDGTVLWDAEFDHGRFISGVYPESEKQSLIDNGMLNEDGTPTADSEPEK